MTDPQVIKVLELYQYAVSATDTVYEPQFAHIRDMIPKIAFFLGQGEREKAMRWLGFIQGVFWTHKIFTIEQMRAHNHLVPLETPKSVTPVL